MESNIKRKDYLYGVISMKYTVYSTFKPELNLPGELTTLVL